LCITASCGPIPRAVLAIERMDDIEIVVVYVMRGNRRRIISARRVHRDERKEYATHLRNTLQGSDRL